MHIVCTDLEGIFTPEIWINVAERTGVAELRLTTRDISDYDVLMKRRLAILREHQIKLAEIQAVIAAMDPLPGAKAFLDWLRSKTPVITVSDTFEQFAGPLMEKLGWPTLFCNTLSVTPDGFVADYHLRQQDGKRHVVRALRSLRYTITAIGDSYNDITMIQSADHGILFNPPDNVRAEHPDLPVTSTYEELKSALAPIIETASGSLGN
jgi:phosphoserine/homoserine phosphotransferase